MPFYEVHHSCSLSDDQRESMAQSITKLHCAAFGTPLFFVHVQFFPHDITSGTYFMAGKRREVNANRVVGIVRTSPSRTKADFDGLASEIEGAWNDLLGQPKVPDPTAEARRLLMVTFVPMVTIREGGMTIPEAGQEGKWLQQQLPHIIEMSARGFDDFTELLEEVERNEV